MGTREGWPYTRHPSGWFQIASRMRLAEVDMRESVRRCRSRGGDEVERED